MRPFRLPNRVLRAKNRVFGSNLDSNRVSGVWPKTEKIICINGMERWQSGRSHRTRNAAYGQPYRGFESLPLRQRPVRSRPIPSDIVTINPDLIGTSRTFSSGQVRCRLLPTSFLAYV